VALEAPSRFNGACCGAYGLWRALRAGGFRATGPHSPWDGVL